MQTSSLQTSLSTHIHHITIPCDNAKDVSNSCAFFRSTPQFFENLTSMLTCMWTEKYNLRSSAVHSESVCWSLLNKTKHYD